MKFSVDSADLGRVFGKLAVGSVLLFVLSVIAIVLLSAIIPEENPTFTITNISTILLIGSWTGIWSSLLAYSVWSLRRLRRMSEEKNHSKNLCLFKQTCYMVALMLEFKEVDSLTPYEERLQLTLQSFVLGLLVLVLPTHAVMTGTGAGIHRSTG